MNNNPDQPSAGAPKPSDGALAKAAWRKTLVTKRQQLVDRAWRNDLIQRTMRSWLIDRPDAVIGAYWAIKGEFDPLPSLYRWGEDHPERRIGLPVKHTRPLQVFRL